MAPKNQFVSGWMSCATLPLKGQWKWGAQSQNQGSMRILLASRRALCAPGLNACLPDALGDHRVGHLHEACHVGALDVVDVAAFLAVAHAVGVDVVHDQAQ